MQTYCNSSEIIYLDVVDTFCGYSFSWCLTSSWTKIYRTCYAGGRRVEKQHHKAGERYVIGSDGKGVRAREDWLPSESHFHQQMVSQQRQFSHNTFITGSPTQSAGRPVLFCCLASVVVCRRLLHSTADCRRLHPHRPGDDVMPLPV